MIANLRATGAALGALTPEEVTAGLGRLLDAWSRPDSAERRELAGALPDTSGLSSATVAAGLDRALAGWNAAALERLVEAELGQLPSEPLPGITTVVHGGVIPMPALVDLLAPLLLRGAVLARPGRHDPITPSLFRRSLETHAPALAGAIGVASFGREDEGAWREALSAERVCITGGDAAVAAVREKLGPGTRLVAHGDKFSLAVLGPDAADLEAAARALAEDVALWDQLGCLSPVACWVIGAPDRSQAFAACLSAALGGRERAWPRGAVDPASRAAIAHERAEAEMRAAAGRAVALHAEDAFTVVAEADAAPRPAPLHRFVRVHPSATLAETQEALAPLADRVAGIAQLGFGDPEQFEQFAAALGATWTAPFGRLQAPPLHWARDGLGPLRALLTDR